VVLSAKRIHQETGGKAGGCYDRNDTPDQYCDKYAEEESSKESTAWFCEAVCSNYEDVLARGEHCDNN
jgi:hypothetical protein